MKYWKVLLLVLALLVGACDGKPGAGGVGDSDVGEARGDKEGGVFKTIGNGLVKKALESQGLGEDLQELMDKRFEAADFGEEGKAVGPVARRSGQRLPESEAYAVNSGGNSGGNSGEAGFLDGKVASFKGFLGNRYADMGRQIHKVRVLGAAHAAEIEIAGGKVGDVVFLIDVRGWAIARLELREAVEEATISVKLNEDPGLAGIDRMWVFEVEGAEILGDLSLYYRDTPVENWHGEPGNSEGGVVRKRELVVNRVDSEGGLEALETRVDPRSDQIVARARLGKLERFVVVY